MNGVMVTVDDARPLVLMSRFGIAFYRQWPWIRRITPMGSMLISTPIDIDIGPLDLSLAKTKLTTETARKIANGEPVSPERLDMLSDLLMAPDERER